MLKSVTLIALVGMSQSAFAQDCPAGQDTTALRDSLHADLRASTSEMEGQALNNQIWEIWTTAPDEMSQKLLDLGRERARVADYARAIEHFNELVEYCPHYAAGWNQRAYTHFLRADYDAALEDIDKVLDIDPRHFGAMAGRATVLLSMGRTAVGYDALREALKIHPWLSERHLLPAEKDI